MSRRENVDASAGRGEQRSEAGTGSAGARQADATSTRQGSGTRARGADQEQRLPMSREGARGGTALSRQQPSLLTSALSMPPGLLAGAFMSNPFAFMRRMTEEMNQILESAGPGTAVDRSARGGLAAGATWMPQVEVRQRENELVVRADLPGVRREDLDVDVEDGVLTIAGERVEEERDEQEGFVRSERVYGRFFRAIPLPDGVDESAIRADFNDGVLELHIPLPAQQQRRGRRLEIGSGRREGRAAEGRTEGRAEGRTGRNAP